MGLIGRVEKSNDLFLEIGFWVSWAAGKADMKRRPGGSEACEVGCMGIEEKGVGSFEEGFGGI